MEQVPIDDLMSDPANPRRMDEAEQESLTRSIQQFGFVAPIVAREADRRVIGGHQRLLVGRRLGMKKVPVVFVDVTAEQAAVLSLALNRIQGEWDEPLLAQLLAELQRTPDIDLTLSGFGDEEIHTLLRSLELEALRGQPEHFDLDAALDAAQRAGPSAPSGACWQLDDHRLICVDATDPAIVARLLADRNARMAFCDPPYNVAYGDHGGRQRGQRRRRLANDALPPEQWAAFCQAWAQNLLAVVDGAIYVCMSTREWPTVSAILAAAGGHWSDTIIWAKDRHVLGRADYQRAYEPIWYGWREDASHHWCGDRDQTDVWAIPRPAVADLHPTMKPLALVEQAIENSSQPNDLVLDLFLGSGSTLIAAERTGRTCYALELDPHYCAVAIARWEAFTGRTAEAVEAEAVAAAR